MNANVQQAIEGIRSAFGDHRLDIEPDGDGGAFLKVHDLNIGGQYEPEISWGAFRITFQCPFADVYPHYLVHGLCRKDGRGLGEV